MFIQECKQANQIARIDVLWLMKHFDCEHKVENILVFAILLTTSSLNLLEMWPRGEVTTKCVISGSFWRTLSIPNQRQWRSLW